MKIKIIAIPILLTFCIMGTLSGCNKSSNNTTSTINSGNTVNSPDNNIKDTIKVEDSKKASNFTKEKEISENSAGKSNGYEIINKTYNKNNIKINYPQVKKLADSAKLKSINKDLEAEALNILDIYLEDDANLTEVTMDINYEVKLKNNKYISIVYLGEGNVKGAAYPQSIIYTTNIDIEKGSSIRLSDYADINDILVKLKDSNNIKALSQNKEIAEMQKANLLNINDTELLNILKDADFYKANGQIERPKKGAYSYMDSNNVVISLEVIHAIGDHAEFKISH